MNLKKNIKKIMVISLSALMVGGTFIGCGTQHEVGMTQADLDAQLLAAKTDGVEIGNLQGLEVGRVEGKASVDVTIDNQEAISNATQILQEQIDSDALIIEDYKQAEEEVVKLSAGYNIDELTIGSTFTKELSDREVTTLFDGKVRFDGERYDAEEVMNVGGTISHNEEDYATKTYLQFAEGDVDYKWIFEEDLNTSDLTEDETLVFNFLGESVEISEWDVDKVTFTSGTEYLVEKGEPQEHEGANITIKSIGDDYAYIQYGVDSRKVSEGDSYDFDGVEIFVDEVINNEVGDGNDFAVIRVAEDVIFEVEDGDEYNEMYDWSITANTIGIVLSQEFVELDETYKPLATGESIQLPNAYATITYNGLLEVDYEKLTFEDDSQYDVEVDGNFKDGTKDYTELYLNASGIYDEDDELVSSTQIEIDNTDGMMLEVTSTNFTVDDVTIPFTMDDITVIGDTNADNFDEGDYVTTYGIIIDDIEDSIEDADSWVLYVPEEELEAEVTVY